MAIDYENIRWLKELSQTNITVIGRKAARLAQLAGAGFIVPRGFVITSTEFFNFLQINNIKLKIAELLKNIDYHDEEDIKKKSEEIKQIIMNGKLSQEAEIEIYKYYNKLGEVGGGWLSSSANAFVAVRCSVVCDAGEVCHNKFIEREGGFLNIKGREGIVKAIKETWATLYSFEVLKYAYNKRINVEKLGVGVIIQNMISAKHSGITITSKSLSDPNTVIIEGIYGFGASHVIKVITPDHYETQKKPFQTIAKTISKQDWELKRVKGETVKVAVQETEKEKQKINTHVLKDLTNTAQKIEELFGTPQIIEWAIDKADIYIISSEPVDPNIIEKTANTQQKINIFKKQLLIKGIGSSSGLVNGVVVVVKDKSDLEKVNNETIIVTTMTDPEMLGAIKLARGVVTNAGSSICHASLTCNELKKPCVVGTRFATEQLLDGEKIQINAQTGEIYSISSLDFVDIHPKDDDFLDEKELRLKKLWEEQRELRSKGAVIINKNTKNKKSEEKKEIPVKKIETPQKIEKKTEPSQNQETINIKNLAKMDITKVKQIVIPIDDLYTAEERAKLSNEFSGAVCVLTKEKIKKILKDIKEL